MVCDMIISVHGMIIVLESYKRAIYNLHQTRRASAHVQRSAAAQHVTVDTECRALRPVS